MESSSSSRPWAVIVLGALLVGGGSFLWLRLAGVAEPGRVAPFAVMQALAIGWRADAWAQRRVAGASGGAIAGRAAWEGALVGLVWGTTFAAWAWAVPTADVLSAVTALPAGGAGPIVELCMLTGLAYVIVAFFVIGATGRSRAVSHRTSTNPGRVLSQGKSSEGQDPHGTDLSRKNLAERKLEALASEQPLTPAKGGTTTSVGPESDWGVAAEGPERILSTGARMDYCKCGEVATGRCTLCATEVCNLHKGTVTARDRLGYGHWWSSRSGVVCVWCGTTKLEAIIARINGLDDETIILSHLELPPLVTEQFRTTVFRTFARWLHANTSPPTIDFLVQQARRSKTQGNLREKRIQFPGWCFYVNSDNCWYLSPRDLLYRDASSIRWRGRLEKVPGLEAIPHPAHRWRIAGMDPWPFREGSSVP